NISAIGAWALITPNSLFISNNATGKVLKLAAIGVNNVPQNPPVIASAPAITGSPPWAITNGIPILAVITVNAANALPINILKSTMPMTYADEHVRGLTSGKTEV